MDYLDRPKAMRHHVTLFVGYILIAIAIVIAALILLYQAHGFGVTRNGDVVQNGLIFFSSQPNPASITINGERKPETTNTRMVLPSAIYDVRLSREGYHDWSRTIELEGGRVKHYDYPFLFPRSLTTEKLAQYEAAPRLFTQSPNQRWLLVQADSNVRTFSTYDLSADVPAEAQESFTLPEAVVSKPAPGQVESWQLIAWADNNNHVILKHQFGDNFEYILLSRSKPAESLNLNTALGIDPVELTLNNRKHDQYFIHDPVKQSLQKASLKEPTPTLLASNVLEYKTYQDDTVLYATKQGAPTGKVLVKVKVDDSEYVVRSFDEGSDYLLDLTKYDGDMYVVAGATRGSRVYIYEDPIGQRKRQPDQMPSPVQVLHVENPTTVSFSGTAQLIMAENGNRFGVYDIENEVGYNYSTTQPIDAPQLRAEWMDGHRLYYVSNGKLGVYDYDNINRQTLMSAHPGYLPAFAPDFKQVYSLAGAANGFSLQQTSLVTPADE